MDKAEQELIEGIVLKLGALIGTTWVELLEDKPEVMYADHELQATKNEIVTLINQYLEKMGALLPKEGYRNGYFPHTKPLRLEIKE